MHCTTPEASLCSAPHAAQTWKTNIFYQEKQAANSTSVLQGSSPLHSDTAAASAWPSAASLGSLALKQNKQPNQNTFQELRYFTCCSLCGEVWNASFLRQESGITSQVNAGLVWEEPDFITTCWDETEEIFFTSFSPYHFYFFQSLLTSQVNTGMVWEESAFITTCWNEIE